jgi:alpha-beta hydrolase superfamily lysophospholipase
MFIQRRRMLTAALAGAVGLATTGLVGCANTPAAIGAPPSGTFSFEATDKAKIFVRRWTPAQGPLRGVVQIAHGAAEHSLRYEEFATFLNSRGYVVYADDHRGHGQSRVRSGALGDEGPDGWNHMVQDEKTLSDLIRKECPGLRLFLFGHSMGSMIAVDYMERYGASLDGVVLCGTSGVFANADAVIDIAQKAAAADPAAPSALLGQVFVSLNAQFTGKPGAEWLSRDPAEVAKYLADPLNGFLFNNEFARDWFVGLRDTWSPQREAQIPKNLPIDVIAGTRDSVGANTETVKLMLARYQTLGLTRVSSRFYPDARHELLKELNRAEVMNDVAKWLDNLTV